MVDNNQLVFAARPGELVEPVTINLDNPWGQPVEWQVEVSETWVVVSPASGTTPASVTVRVNTTGLLPGEHVASVTFVASRFADDPQVLQPVVWVRFTLTAPGWQGGFGPWGGRVYSVAADGDAGGRVLAGDARGQIWLSDDGGQSFRQGQQLLGEIWDLALDGESGVAYAGSASNGLWRSSDAGNTWQATPYIGAVHQIALAPDDAQAVYVRGESGVAFSADGGQSWSSVFDGAVCVCTGAADPDEVFACDGGHSF